MYLATISLLRLGLILEAGAEAVLTQPAKALGEPAHGALRELRLSLHLADLAGRHARHLRHRLAEVDTCVTKAGGGHKRRRTACAKPLIWSQRRHRRLHLRQRKTDVCDAFVRSLTKLVRQLCSELYGVV